MISDLLVYFYLPFFILIYGMAAYSDWRTKKINALGFYFLKGLVYTGLFLVDDKTILVGLALDGCYFIFSAFQNKIFKQKIFGNGDFTMMGPISMVSYLFLDFTQLIVVHVSILLAGFLWVKVSKDRSFAPPLFLVVCIIFGLLAWHILG